MKKSFEKMRLAKIALIEANILWSEAEEIVAYSRISSKVL
jgi:hypothetical protein